MALKDFKVLTFDVVGTLIDFEGGMLDYFRRAVPDSAVTDDDFLEIERALSTIPIHGDRYPEHLERLSNK